MVTGQRYPFATADGIAIPSDIIKPLGVLRQTFSHLIATVPVAIPAAVEVISFLATEDCIVVFGVAATVPVNAVLLADALFVPANIIVQAAPPLSNMSVIGLTASGTLMAQYIESWAGLTRTTQLTRN